MKRTALLCATFLTGVSALAQDIYTTQYISIPLSLNPAMAGLMPEDVRVAASQQYLLSPNAVYNDKISNISLDMGLLKGKLPKGDALGVGVNASFETYGNYDDKSSDVGVSAAYHKSLDSAGKHHLSIGLRYAWAYERMNEYVAPPNYFSTSYSDLNAGIVYSGRLSRHATAYIGYSMRHVTQPVISYGQPYDRRTIAMTHVINAGGAFDIGKKTVLYANALYQSQNSANDLAVGAYAGYSPGRSIYSSTIIYAGLWHHYAEAISPYVGFEYARIRIGFSYDKSIDRFTSGNGNVGFFTTTLICSGFTGKPGKRQQKWSCPQLF